MDLRIAGGDIDVAAQMIDNVDLMTALLGSFDHALVRIKTGIPAQECDFHFDLFLLLKAVVKIVVTSA